MLDAIDVRGLLALLLPDGSLVSYRTPSGGYVQLTMTAGARDTAFLEEKVAEFRQFIPSRAQIIHYDSSPRANGKTTPCLRFRASSNKLRPIYNLLYPGGERRITDTTLGMLGAQAAAWIWAHGAHPMVDGSVQLSRVGGGIDEAELVAGWLEMLTGATCSPLSTGDLKMRRPRLLFAPPQASKMRQALLPYAPQSRQHLFFNQSWDVSTIRSARTELLHRVRHDRAAGSEGQAVA